MILITGMPRSGTNYTCNMILEHGHKFEPPLICSPQCWDHRQHGLWLNEPARLTQLLGQGRDEKGLARIDNFLKSINELHQSTGAEPVLKHFGITEVPHTAEYFSRILVYGRSYKTWHRSAMLHPATIRHAFSFGGFRKLYEHYRTKSLEYVAAATKHKTPVMFFDFDKPENLYSLWMSLGAYPLLAESLTAQFNGSRW